MKRRNAHAILAATLGAALVLVAPLSARADFETGMNYFKSGKYVEAAAEFQALVDSSPEYDYGYFILGLSFLQLGKAQDALNNFQKAIDLNGDKFEYHKGLADALGLARWTGPRIWSRTSTSTSSIRRADSRTPR